jgi:hypothetical protein
VGRGNKDYLVATLVVVALARLAVLTQVCTICFYMAAKVDLVVNRLILMLHSPDYPVLFKFGSFTNESSTY